MLEQKTFDMIMNAYLQDVDGVLKSNGLLSKKGTSELDDVQKEVDMTLDQLREMQRNSASSVALNLVVGQSVARAAVYSSRVRHNAAVPLSGIFGSLSDQGMLAVPAWKDAFTRISGQIGNFTNSYGQLISNMDPSARREVDTALASIINNAEVAFSQNQTATGAASYLRQSLTSLEQIESVLRNRQQHSSAAMLSIAIKQKDQERIKLLSNAKIIEKQATPAQMSVVNEASRRAMGQLNEMLNDPTSYDAAIRQKKFDLVDSDLAIIERTIQGIRFGNDLGRAPPHTPHGKKGALNQHFREASTSNLGGGFMSDYVKSMKKNVKDSLASKTKAQSTAAIKAETKARNARKTTSLESGIFNKVDLATVKQSTLLDAIQRNAAYLQVNRKLQPDELLHFTQQINSLNAQAYNGDAQTLSEAKKRYNALVTQTSNLGGFYNYDEPQLAALPNWARLGVSVVTYPTLLAVLALGIYLSSKKMGKPIGSNPFDLAEAKKNTKANLGM